MKKKEIKKFLSQGKKVATPDMIKNGDYLYLKGSTVVRTWGGNEMIIGDKYFNWETKNNWRVL